MTLHGSWRIYHTTVDMPGPQYSPLELLRSFTNVYGRPITVGSKVAKLFVLESLPWDGSRLNVHMQGGTVEGGMFVRFDDERHVVDIALAFEIDMPRYVGDLQRLGVNVPEWTPPS
jgi:hypothetical protein